MGHVTPGMVFPEARAVTPSRSKVTARSTHRGFTPPEAHMELRGGALGPPLIQPQSPVISCGMALVMYATASSTGWKWMGEPS